MKTLTDHTILYDDECPMCKEYTKAFVKTGMLDKTGREAYTDAANSNLTNVDWNRARNEIAMINKKDGTVIYGAESILTIIGHSFPIFQPLFNFKFFRFLVKRLYFFVSYNRKVVAPGKVFEGCNTCTPDMNYAYRWAYIVFAWLVTSVILVFYSKLAVPLFPESEFAREFIVCGGQILFQGAIVLIVRKERAIHYLGNVMTISLGGALLLLPMFLVARFIDANEFFIGYFMVIVALMFFEHLRRVKILELPWYISVTWVLYRFLVLFVILYLL
ncbi:MAG TPA: DCC1-like thiol-disulfide oxidoreductase family protein [Cyclobacteriaceae bacterium]|nr:DCC1-like thiol-disulfide oxidoreductase family protein [Cyclobacteriaceae bacterium]